MLAVAVAGIACDCPAGTGLYPWGWPGCCGCRSRLPCGSSACASSTSCRTPCLPSGAAVTVGPGVVIAVVGGGIAFAASCASLGYRTWRPGAEPAVSIGWLSAASALGLVVLWATDLQVAADRRRASHWTLGADAIPGVGDATAAAVVALFAAALALAVTARRWLAVAVVSSEPSSPFSLHSPGWRASSSVRRPSA